MVVVRIGEVVVAIEVEDINVNSERRGGEKGERVRGLQAWRGTGVREGKKEGGREENGHRKKGQGVPALAGAGSGYRNVGLHLAKHVGTRDLPYGQGARGRPH